MEILIAEDNVTSRTLLKVIISKWGFQVLTVEDGFEAWKILKEKTSPSIAVLDWMMPKMDGIEVCRRVTQLERTNPAYLILLTGRDSKADISSGLEAGASDYITKPFDANELRARLRVAERMIALQGTLNRNISELQDALTHVKTLQGVLPICMHCHKIRTDDKAWQRLEAYIEVHSDAKFSHGLCPECLEKHY
jgi:DNA-binding response OmpR family regulator